MQFAVAQERRVKDRNVTMKWQDYDCSLLDIVYYSSSGLNSVYMGCGRTRRLGGARLGNRHGCAGLTGVNGTDAIAHVAERPDSARSAPPHPVRHPIVRSGDEDILAVGGDSSQLAGTAYLDRLAQRGRFDDLGYDRCARTDSPPAEQIASRPLRRIDASPIYTRTDFPRSLPLTQRICLP